ncbi:hypothetical protein NHQ30_004430 [Ciborinia camelliae]|nr:hypothetical protein NHQ30_004430 [Ciborinia camelliae]
MIMSSNGMMQFSATPAKASGTGNLNTIQEAKVHFRNASSNDYVQPPGPHLSEEELGSVVLRIEVGSGKEPGCTVTFQVHRKLLSTKVANFQKAFGDKFQEAADPAEEMPDFILVDDDPKAFKLLVGWLYTGTIERDFEKFSNPTDTSSFKGSLKGLLKSINLPIYIKLCILAEKYEITRLENEAMNILIKFMTETKARANTSCWLEVYKNTTSRSALRLLFSRIAVWQLSQEGGFDGSGAMDLESVLCRNEDLRLDISALMKVNMGSRPADPLLASVCNCHNHGWVEECPYAAV